MSDSKRTPLYDRHVQLGAKMIDFVGWLMPVQYRNGIIVEHMAVRTGAGIFDVSHMGEIRVKGRGAGDYVDRLVTNVVPRQPGRIAYSPMCYPHGGIVDDLLVYCVGDEDYLLVVNAANTEKDYEWIARSAPAGVTVEDESPSVAQVAVQGPRAVAVASAVLGEELGSLKRFTHVRLRFDGAEALVSRTGYTGEDGCEIYIDGDKGAALWDAFMSVPEELRPEPAGLGARDTLRFEASYRLYGNDMDETTSPLEAGLGWTVKLDKKDFVGKNALVAQMDGGLSRKFIGLRIHEKRIARKGCEILDAGQPVGTVTSGAYAPFLKESLAMGYVKAELAEPGRQLSVSMRGRTVSASVVKLPFLSGRDKPRPASAG